MVGVGFQNRKVPGFELLLGEDGELIDGHFVCLGGVFVVEGDFLEILIKDNSPEDILGRLIRSPES